MFVLSILILPVRASLTGLTFLLALAMANFITPKSLLASSKPQNDWKRRWLMPVLVLISRTVYFLGGFHWVKVKGQRASRSDAPIIVLGPHSSYLDSLAVVVMGMPSCVATAEHASSFIGGFIRVLQPILVNREDRHSRAKTIAAICARAKSKADWPQLLIFPEGTCTNRSCLISFRQGAFQPGVPVQPVLLRWPNTVDSSTWVWQGPSVWKLLWMTFTQFTVRLEIEFLPVYYPSLEERKDPRLYANNVRAIMAKALNIPTCDLVYDDFCRFQVARECGLPDPEAMAYLHALLRAAFSFSRLGNCTWNGATNHRDWVHRRLEKLLFLARRNKCLSQLDFMDALFPNIQLDERETLLINQAIEHYRAESDGEVDFRKFMTRACMFLYASDLRMALHYAVKAFPPQVTNSIVEAEEPVAGLDGMISSWAISIGDAKQLIVNVFNVNQENDGILDSLFDLLDEHVNHGPEIQCNGEVVSFHPDHLFAVLSNLSFTKCYRDFENKFGQLLGKRGRPLLHFEETDQRYPWPYSSSRSTINLVESHRTASSRTLEDVSSVEVWLPNTSNNSVRLTRKLSPASTDCNQACAAAYRRTMPTPPLTSTVENT